MVRGSVDGDVRVERVHVGEVAGPGSWVEADMTILPRLLAGELQVALAGWGRHMDATTGVDPGTTRAKAGGKRRTIAAGSAGPWVVTAGSSRAKPAERRSLDMYVGLFDTEVVDIDMGTPGMIAPPRAASPLTDVRSQLAHVAGRTEAQLVADLMNALRTGQPTRRLVDVAGDGSPKIPSLVAVWLISQVGVVVGRPKLVDVGKVRREDLRSVRGVARLVHAALYPAAGGAQAS